MPGNFIYSNRDHKFILKEWLDTEKILNFDKFKDTYAMDDVDMILDEGLKVAREVVAPTNIDGDRIGARLEDGKVITPPSFHKLYQFMQENGYGNSQFDPEEEGKLPTVLLTALEEFFNAANPAFYPYIGLAKGATNLIELFGTEEDRKRFLPRMYSGQWSGTMCLTEPCCGSDVGEITTRAYPTEDPRVYKIKGTKCFITAGDHDLTENIIHLLLARCEGAAPGTKGISLFIVPKIWVNEDGSLGEPNDITTLAIEHKMGIKGSATAMLSFGDEGKCRGILLGNPPDENGKGEGMAQMFVMMNGARQSTGLTAMAIAQAAYNHALQYARERIQGRTISNPRGPRVRIIEHEDIRRMLLFQKSIIEASRAMIMKNSYYRDLATYSNDPEERKTALRRIEVNTPLIKAYPSDMAWQTIAEAIQIHGGYGFTEEYPVAQCARDSKILSIWEGTNFIQSLDLVGRKWRLDEGKIFAEWFKDVADSVESNKNIPGFEREYEIMNKAVSTYREMRETFTSRFARNIRLMPLYSTRVLHATAILWGGSLLMDQAAVATKKMQELGENHYDYPFYQGKVQTARFYIRNIVPEIFKIAEIIRDGDTSAIDILEEGL
ncbi:Acyl-CoA dehydrogenase [Desulfofundulus australicus DSM 11792]|uniref:Acyl-CoA dehydrogenase n=1 Tax=Desulfofundulus australicus DSM 11792 TaxID=1121425 RepID=A0A1M5AKE3_9FIRM|nr:acyl-CoA dehydrogenase [Desulfofundulus australicus]SHF30731.1 Acyl-CoA dehydrogenase [Desulfofundulus australicus DSM 11792]